MEQNGYRPFWQTVNMEKNGEEGCYLIFVRPVTNLEDFSRNLGSMHVYIHGDKLAESFLNTPQEEVYYIKSGDGKLLTVSDRNWRMHVRQREERSDPAAENIMPE